MNLTFNIFIAILGIISVNLLILIFIKIFFFMEKSGKMYVHFQFIRNRHNFNKLGIEIINGAVSKDTFYLVLRSGTIFKEFADRIKRFRKLNGTRLIVIVPDIEVFLSNVNESLHRWCSELYENPDCNYTRALFLEPGEIKPNESRLVGYLFVSDGHNHSYDEGVCTVSVPSAKYLLGYINSLIKSGKRIEI